MPRGRVSMERLGEIVDAVAAEERFSGAVRVDDADGAVLERAFGLADRRWGVPFTPATRAGIASGTKGFTALVGLALAEAGAWSLSTTARSLLGRDLPAVDARVTVEHLLAHRSGIGDYLDESAIDDVAEHVLGVPVHRLDSTAAYAEVLDGRPQVSAPGTCFAYSNAGYVLLALLAERAAGAPFAELVETCVCRPAGLDATGFVRADALPPGVATGYLDADGLRTNALHLPLLGSGDGGLFSTVADLRALWLALFAGGIVAPASVASMTRARSEVPAEEARFGLGLWLAERGRAAWLEGYDAGVSFRSVHDPASTRTYTVIGNWSGAAWPVLRALRAALAFG